MALSIIIPTLNEEDVIAKTIEEVISRSGLQVQEIIVCDGGSTDTTRQLATHFQEVRVVKSPQKGRAVQMNYGAAFAKAETLFFLHADTVPPKYFDEKIASVVNRDSEAGCFRLSFDYNHPILQFYGWCTKFNVDAFRFGDQGLFISREVFQKIGGFREDHFLMEDNEIVTRIKRDHSFKIMPDNVITSARKYKRNGIIRLQLIFLLVYVLYNLGISQKMLRNLHQELIN